MSIRLWIAIAAVGLSACATVYEGKYDWYDGWRQGRVDAIGSQEDFPGAFKVCRSESPQEKYANVAYVYPLIHMRRIVHQVVPIHDPSIRVGQDVFINVRSCDQDLQPRTDGVAL